VPTTTVVDTAPGGSSPGGAARADTERPTVAIVFDALRPEALELAQKAALSYIPMSGETGSKIGVFASEPGFRVLQAYTDDVTRVRRAVQSVTAVGTSKQDSEAERKTALNQRLLQLDSLGAGGETLAAAAGNDPTAIAATIEQQMTQLEMRMLRTFDSLDRDHRGFGTANSLLSVIHSLSVLPGRKTLVYLSEGLPASPSLQARFDTVVSAANRSNVSVYTIDAAGLRAESTLVETRREIDAAGQERLRQSVSRDATDGPLMRVVERTEDLLRLDPQGGLARLAEDTGGFLIRDTNDLGSAFKRIDEDNRFHYLLTYSPSNAEFDGKFRSISVRVKRDDMQVFARKGYLAVRPSAFPVLSYEAPALAALDRGRPPNAFPMSANGFVFPGPKGTAAMPMVVQVRTRELHFRVEPAKNTYSAQAAVVARLKNTHGHVVHTLSQQYILTGAAADVGAAKEGEILFYRQPELAPGVYTFEAIVYDALAERASARISTVTVPPAAGNRTPASALVLVRRAEMVPNADRRPDLPLYYGEMLLYPNAGEPLRRGVDNELVFYFAFYTAPEDGEPSAVLDILHSGTSVASMPLALAKTAAGVRAQHVGKLPIDKFPAGTYELRLRLRTGEQEQVRTAFFTVAG
jgi:VWFA-related protein